MKDDPATKGDLPTDDLPTKEDPPMKDEVSMDEPPPYSPPSAMPPPPNDPAPSSSASSRRTSKPHIDLTNARPEDFEGAVDTNDELPTRDLIQSLENYVLLDSDGKSHPFHSLYRGPNIARRVLVVFVRHFFCGNCQEFLRTLSEAVTPDSLLQLPVSTFIAIVGCGAPGLIESYTAETNCAFPIYTDPTGSLFNALGMTKTWALGEKPVYIRKSMANSVVSSIFQGLRHLPMAFKSGDFRQVGGEFLFEPPGLSTPYKSSFFSVAKRADSVDKATRGERKDDEEEKQVTWCHRMRTTRDHTEVTQLMELLGLRPSKDLPPLTEEMRKGTGHTMGEEIRKLSEGQVDPL